MAKMALEGPRLAFEERERGERVWEGERDRREKGTSRLFQVDFSKLSPFFIFFESCLLDVFFDEELKFDEKTLSKMTTFPDMMENVVKNKEKTDS